MKTKVVTKVHYIDTQKKISATDPSTYNKIQSHPLKPVKGTKLTVLYVVLFLY